MKLYTVYNNKTDKVVIVDGTRKECLSAMRIKPDSFHHYLWFNHIGKKCKWTIIETETELPPLTKDSSFGERMRYHRIHKDITARDMARLAGIHYQSLINYEGDRCEPPISYAVRIADVLGLSLDYLTGRREENVCDT